MLSFVSTDRSRDASGNISDETDRLHGIISREIYAYCAIKSSNGSLCNKKSNMRRNIYIRIFFAVNTAEIVVYSMYA